MTLQNGAYYLPSGVYGTLGGDTLDKRRVFMAELEGFRTLEKRYIEWQEGVLERIKGAVFAVS